MFFFGRIMEKTFIKKKNINTSNMFGNSFPEAHDCCHFFAKNESGFKFLQGIFFE